MQLILPPEIVQQLIDALGQAGRREIGGILMGEHVGPDAFRLKELTVQRKEGTFAGFRADGHGDSRPTPRLF